VTSTLFFIFGTLIGSFLNVVILRYHSGGIFSKRSRCFSCSKTLTWIELIPIISYLVLRGRCHACKSLISQQYILVEIGTGLLFLFVWLKGYTGMDMLFPLTAISILIAIFVYDIYHKIIPNGLVYAFIALSLVQMVVHFNPLSFSVPSTASFFAGPLLFVPFFAMWFYSKGLWMGLGDGNLALGIGWFLGLSMGVSAIIIAFWVGALVSILLLVFQKFRSKQSNTLSMKSEVPFAPFLIVGFLAVFLFDISLTQFIIW